MSKDSLPLIICFLLAPLSGMSIDLYAPSLPYIAQFLGVSQSVTQLTMTVFLLGFGLGQIPFGALSDTYGRRTPLMIGLTLYTLASLIAVLWPHITVLLIARFFQGLASSAPSALTKSIVKDRYEGLALKRNLSLLTTGWGLGPIFGPVIGGYLQAYFGWRAGFIFFTVLGASLLLFVGMKLEETHHHRIALNFQAMRQRFKILLTCRSYLSSIAMMGLAYALLIIFNIMGPFIIQKTLGYTAIDFGHVAFVAGLIFISATYLNRWLLNYFDVTQLIKIAALFGLAMAILMGIVAFTMTLSFWPFVITSLLLMSIVGIVYPSNVVYSMGLFPEIAGTAAAVMGTVNLVSVAVYSAVASFLPTKNMHAYSLLYLFVAALIVLLALTAFGFDPRRKKHASPHQGI